MKLPEWAKDGIYTSVRIKIDWRDRIRIALGYDIDVYIDTACENVIGRAESSTQIQLVSPRGTPAAQMVQVRG